MEKSHLLAIGYGVTANIAASHEINLNAAARGSIPRTRTLVFRILSECVKVKLDSSIIMGGNFEDSARSFQSCVLAACCISKSKQNLQNYLIL
jgi:hypothetical protein